MSPKSHRYRILENCFIFVFLLNCCVCVCVHFEIRFLAFIWRARSFQFVLIHVMWMAKYICLWYLVLFFFFSCSVSSLEHLSHEPRFFSLSGCIDFNWNGYSEWVCMCLFLCMCISNLQKGTCVYVIPGEFEHAGESLYAFDVYCFIFLQSKSYLPFFYGRKKKKMIFQDIFYA